MKIKLLLPVFLLYLLLSVRVPSVSYAATTTKIMTFNVLSGPSGGLCTLSNKQNMQAIVNFIKNNNISLAALQEVIKQKDSDACDFDHIQYLKDAVALSAPEYTVTEREYIHATQGSSEVWWYRVFIHNTAIIPPIVTSSTAASNSQGAEAIVLDTQAGKIRFINLHPQPGTQALTLDTHLLPFIDQFRNDGIPMVIMGDFNLRYDYADAAPVLSRIEQAGFYRACDPVKFPNGGCNDTITPNSSTSNFAVDYIFIDKRANFIVSNAYVEQSMQFSDHLPVVVELSLTTLPDPTGLSRTCNANGTATFRWNAVAGTGEYGFRLDRQPFTDWYNSATDTIVKTANTSVTVPVIYGTQYQWAVTAVTTPGSTHPLPTWQPAFICTAPTLVPTSTPTTIPTPTIIPIPGDNNPKDGKISSTELYAILRSYYTNTATYDTNGDAKINSFDFRFIRPYVH